jgi:hypothetical protein
MLGLIASLFLAFSSALTVGNPVPLVEPVAQDAVVGVDTGVSGVFSGVVYQATQNVYFNATIALSPSGTGSAFFWNPHYGFACYGGTLAMGGNAYVYSLQVDSSTTSNTCLTWANFQLDRPSRGISKLSFFAHGASTPTFTAMMDKIV